MIFIYEKETLEPISFIDFIRAPVSFGSRPLIICEPFEGLPPPCTPAEERFSYADSMRTIHQSFRVTPYQFKTHRLWLLASQTISQSLIDAVLALCREFPFQQFTAFAGVDTSVFFDLKPTGSFSSGLRPPSAGLRGSSPVCGVSPLGTPRPLHVRRSHDRTLQTTFSVASDQAVYRPSHDIDEIDDHLFVGNEAAAGSVEVLRRYGITHIVKLNGNEGKACFPEQFEYFIVSLADGEFQELDHKFWEALKFVRTAIDTGGCVFLHCRRGISRSAALGLAYLVEAKGMTLDHALEHLEQRRPIAKINPGFLEQIRTRAAPRPAKRFLPGLRLPV
jgi:hypothetical protein